MKNRRPGKKILRSKETLAPPKSGDKPRPSKVKELHFGIVGIGASAGGLEAFEQFFSAMPPDSNLGFVLVPHLDPTHSSMLPELLQRRTTMTVQPARNGTQVAPNQIYVVPPNKDIEILRGVLYLSDPSTRQASRGAIDLFFHSLAVDQRQKAVGILFSGSGSDGTAGLKAIKSEYGMVIVQNPESAKFRGMPTSAIDAGVADFILMPAKMPEQLLAYTAHFAGKVVGGKVGWVERTGNALNPIFLLLRSQTGHDFSSYKRNTISRRIERRMNIHQIRDVAQYTRYLKQNPQEVEMLFKELLIGVTSFFRDPEAFELLRRRLAEILTGKPKDLRFWVPGCSSGEEVYSLAMIVREAMDEAQATPKIQIFGTDIDTQAIDTARGGRYAVNAVAGVSPERLKRFFVREGTSVRIKKEIRELALFAVQDVIKDPPFTKVDLICCRNLLIYLDGDLQKRLIPLFHYSLRPRGLLVLGTSETIGRYAELFVLVDKKWKLYRRKDGGIAYPNWEFDFGRSLAADGGARTDADLPSGRHVSVTEVAERVLLDQYAPPSVIVNHKGDILYAHGRTGKFLELASGNASLNVFEMAREGLRLELTSAVRRCRQLKKAVTLQGLKVKTNGGYQPMDLAVRSLREGDDRLGNLTLVAFHELAGQKVSKGRKAASPAKASLKRIAELEQELRSTQESLQTTIEEMETSNEELKSMNEEMQSTNEELQSTNEELETSKEEMQSLNEELVTVNSELQAKIEELSKLNNDMKNLLDSTHIATLFLDMQLRITRFTPDATKIVNLMASDIGRPLSDIASNLRQEDLVRDAKSVLETLIPKEIVVKTADLRSFLMRIMPYRTLENHIDGIVMTFTDIGAEYLLESARDFAQGILETVREPLVILDAKMKVLQANPAFYKTFAVDTRDIEQSVFFDLGSGQWNIPQLRKLLGKILSENSHVKDFEVKHDFPGIGVRTMLVSARRIFHLAVRTDTILLAIDDVSKRRPRGGYSHRQMKK